MSILIFAKFLEISPLNQELIPVLKSIILN
jgi:hypothetical protein